MKKKIITLISGILVSGIFLYFAFKNVPISELIGYIATINYYWIIPAVLVTTISLIIRVLRWQIILGASTKLSFMRVFHPLMIGFMLNLILPGRAGEIARPLILKQKEGLPFTTGLATVAAERMFDLIVLIILLTVVLTFVNIDPDIEIKFKTFSLNKDTIEMVGKGLLNLCLLLIVSIGILLFQKTRNLIGRIIMGIPAYLFTSESKRKKIQDVVCIPLVDNLDRLSSGFNLIRSPKKILSCFGLSLMVWFLQAFSFYIVALGCPGIELSFYQHIVVMVIICIFISLPSVPGFWGLWEAGGVFALTLFSVSTKNAAGYTLANHAIQLFPILIIGIISAIMISVNIFTISYDKYDD